jgi:hypothetical protein
MTIQTTMTAGEFEVEFYGTRYIEAVKASLGNTPHVTQQDSDVRHAGSVWDAIFVLTDGDNLHALLTGAAYVGGAITTGALGAFGVDLYNKAKKLVIGCHAEHRRKVIVVRKHDPDRPIDDLGYGVKILFGIKGDKKGDLDVSFRTNNIDGTTHHLLENQRDDRMMAFMMAGFEKVVAPKILNILERSPNTQIRTELRTTTSDLPVEGWLSVETAGFAPELITFDFSSIIESRNSNLK